MWIAGLVVKVVLLVLKFACVSIFYAGQAYRSKVSVTGSVFVGENSFYGDDWPNFVIFEFAKERNSSRGLARIIPCSSAVFEMCLCIFSGLEFLLVLVNFERRDTLSPTLEMLERAALRQFLRVTSTDSWLSLQNTSMISQWTWISKILALTIIHIRSETRLSIVMIFEVRFSWGSCSKLVSEASAMMTEFSTSISFPRGLFTLGIIRKISTEFWR